MNTSLLRVTPVFGEKKNSRYVTGMYDARTSVFFGFTQRRTH